MSFGAGNIIIDNNIIECAGDGISIEGTGDSDAQSITVTQNTITCAANAVRIESTGVEEITVSDNEITVSTNGNVLWLSVNQNLSILRNEISFYNNADPVIYIDAENLLSGEIYVSMNYNILRNISAERNVNTTLLSVSDPYLYVNAQYNYWAGPNAPRQKVGNPANYSGYYFIDGYINYLNWIGQEFVMQYNFGGNGGSAALGLYSQSFSDMVVGTPGISVDFSRTYNSQDSRSKSFGAGWSFGFEGFCEDYKYIFVLEDGTTEEIVFEHIKGVRLPDGSVLSFTKFGDAYRSDNSSNTFVENADGSFTLTTKSGYVYEFNTAGYLVSVTDHIGNKLLINVDATGKVQGVTDAVNREYGITYNADGFISKITDPIGREVSYTYVGGRLATVIDPMGLTKYAYEYDAEGFLCKVTDATHALSKTLVYIHDGGENDGKVQSITDALGNTTTLTYDKLNRMTTKTDSNGRQTIVWYTESFQTIKSQDPEGKISTTDYHDNAGNPYRTTGPERESLFTYEYDERGNVIKITNPTAVSGRRPTTKWNNTCGRARRTSSARKCSMFSDGLRRSDATARPLNSTDVYSETADPALSRSETSI